MAQTFLQKIRIQLEGADKASKGAKKVSKGMGDLAKKAMAAGAAYFGSKALIEGIKQSTAAFGVQEQAQRKLIKSTGSAATSLSLLASSLQKQTRFGDEATMAQMSFLGSIGMPEKQIKSIMPVAMDLAAATGMTLESAVRNTAKTFSGLAGELGELIPQLRGLTAEEMKAGEAVKIMADLFGGQAKAQTETMTGSMEQMKNAVGDTAEAIGSLLSPAIIGGSKVLKSMAESLSSAIEDFDRFMTGGNNNVKVLSDLEYQSMLFNQKLDEIGDNEHELLAIGKEIEKQRDAEQNSVGLSTEALIQYEMQLKMVSDRLNLVNMEESELTIKREHQLNHFKKMINDYGQFAKVQVKAIKEVDKEEQLYYARSLSGLRGMIKSKIQAYFAEMIAGFTAREISTKGWVGIATASAGAIAAGAIFDALIPQFQTGGLVSGNSHERGGKNINVEGGEFVMSRNAVNAIGVENLNAMNQGSSGGGGVTVNINGGLITPEFVENDLAEAIREGARRGADFGIS